MSSGPGGLRGILITLAVVSALMVPAIVLADPANTATVQFGNPDSPSVDQNCIRGSATVPPEPCASAFHKLIPGAVAIDNSGTVNFVRNGFHQVAIYAPGKMPNDVVVTGAAVGRVNDASGRVFLSAAGNGGTVTPPAAIFAESGRYLVICNILSHFDQNMWGWVVVE